jgi:hypothetical protein
MTLQSAIDDTRDMLACHEQRLRENPTSLERLIVEGLYIRLRKLERELAEETGTSPPAVLPLDAPPAEHRTPAS